MLCELAIRERSGVLTGLCFYGCDSPKPGRLWDYRAVW